MYWQCYNSDETFQSHCENVHTDPGSMGPTMTSARVRVKLLTTLVVNLQVVALLLLISSCERPDKMHLENISKYSSSAKWRQPEPPMNVNERCLQVQEHLPQRFFWRMFPALTRIFCKTFQISSSFCWMTGLNLSQTFSQSNLCIYTSPGNPQPKSCKLIWERSEVRRGQDWRPRVPGPHLQHTLLCTTFSAASLDKNTSWKDVIWGSLCILNGCFPKYRARCLFLLCDALVVCANGWVNVEISTKHCYCLASVPIWPFLMIMMKALVIGETSEKACFYRIAFILALFGKFGPI